MFFNIFWYINIKKFKITKKTQAKIIIVFSYFPKINIKIMKIELNH